MKKIVILFCIIVVCISVQASPTFPVSKKIKYWTSITDNGGNIIPIQGGSYGTYNPLYLDTLGSADTLVVIFPLHYPTLTQNGSNSANIPYSTNTFPYIVESWKSTGTHDTANVTVTYWQSLDGTVSANAVNYNWFQVTAGASPSAYSKTEAVRKIDQAYFETDFARTIVWFNARYLAIRYISATKSGFKMCPKVTLRNNVH